MPKNKLTSESIIDNLIKIRDINGWTNYKIAIKCDLPSATVSNIFKKQSVPQLDTLLALCRGLGISFSYLIKVRSTQICLNQILSYFKCGKS